MKQSNNKWASFPLLGLVFALGSQGIHAKSTDTVNAYLDSICKIKSYDVTYVMDILIDGGKGGGLTPGLTQTNRDMFSADAGWRVENAVNSPEEHTIAIMDAKSIADRIKSDTVVSPGLTYNTYLDPIFKGVYLRDILADKHSTIQPVPATPGDGGIVQYKLRNPGLQAFDYLQIAFDPAHDNLLKKIELYVTAKNKRVILIEKTEVQEFVKTSGQAWFPSKILRSMMSAEGVAVSGEQITLDLQHSKFNLPVSEDMFLAKSLPAVNAEDQGWKYYYPPALLPGIKETASIMNKLAAPDRKFKTWMLTLFLASNVLIIGFILLNARKIKTHPAQ
jgi:hypothetical protein